MCPRLSRFRPALILTFLLLAAAPLRAQPAWQWARRATCLSEFNNIVASSTASDSQGNVYVAGTFGATADFTEPHGYLTNAGNGDIFLAKYNANGALLWNRRFGGSGADFGHVVAVDPAGFVYLAGRISGPVTFGATLLTNAFSGFVAKLDPATTNVIWAKADALEWFGGAVDSAGNFHVAGQPPGLQLVNLKLAGPVALAKYDSAGNRLWYTNSMSSNFSAIGAGRAVAVDGTGNVYITGNFRSTIQFGGAWMTNATPANNTRDEVFVAKFNAAGIPQWARRGGGSGDDIGRAIGVNSAGEVFVSGSCDDTRGYNGGISLPCEMAGVTFPASTGGGLGNMFLAEYTSSGVGVRARKLAGKSAGFGLVVLPTGPVVVTGEYGTASLDFGGLTLSKAWATEEIFVVAYDAAGNAIWGRQSSSVQPGFRTGRCVALGLNSSIYAAGTIETANESEFDGTRIPGFSSRTSLYVGKLVVPTVTSPPTVQGLTLLGATGRRLSLSGASASTYAVETSSNLLHWISISTNMVSNDSLDFNDAEAVGAATRYYRLRN